MPPNDVTNATVNINKLFLNNMATGPLQQVHILNSNITLKEHGPHTQVPWVPIKRIVLCLLANHPYVILTIKKINKLMLSSFN